MQSILRYIFEMVPYMLIATIIYVVVRVLVVRRQRKKINIKREVVFYLFVIFIAGLASQTIIPSNMANTGFHRTNLVPFKTAQQTYYAMVNYGITDDMMINILGNIAMFMPFGFVIPLLWRANGIKTVLIGFGISLFIEVCQLFLPRATDVDDLILNTLGALLGYLVYMIFNKMFPGCTKKFKTENSKNG